MNSLSIDVAESAGLRHGSKQQRVYEAVRKALSNSGVLRIDEIIQALEPLGVFSAVTNRRANVANLLSQLKQKKLLWSDHRGNWYLPARKEPDPALVPVIRTILDNLCPDCRKRSFNGLVALYKEQVEEFRGKHAELIEHKEHLDKINNLLTLHGVDVREE